MQKTQQQSKVSQTVFFKCRESAYGLAKSDTLKQRTLSAPWVPVLEPVKNKRSRVKN